MSLISLLVVLILVGFALWLVQQIPIDATIKRIIQGVVILFIVLWLLQAVGLVGSLGDIRIR